MKLPYLIVTPVVAVGLLSASCAMVQKAAPGSLSDANVVSVLNTADRADIEGGHLAQSKASRQEVQAYGRKMVEDHSSSLHDSKQLSRRLNMPPQASALSEKLMDDHDDAMESLRNKSGQDFDRAYIDHEIDMHQELIGLVTSAATSVDNAALKQHLLKVKPVLQSHLERARSIRQALERRSE